MDDTRQHSSTWDGLSSQLSGTAQHHATPDGRPCQTTQIYEGANQIQGPSGEVPDLVADLNDMDDDGKGWSLLADARDVSRVANGGSLIAANSQAADLGGQVTFSAASCSRRRSTLPTDATRRARATNGVTQRDGRGAQ